MTSLGFSYAQAAKGLPPSSNVSSQPVSSASSEHGAKDHVAAGDDSRSSRNAVKSENTNAASRPSQSSIPTEESRPQSDHNLAASANAIDEQKTPQPQKSSLDESSPPTGLSEPSSSSPRSSTEEQGESAQPTAETQDLPEKGKEADDDWEKVSIPSVTPDKELKAAPIPAVNIWQQRSLAQQAKAKEQTVQRPAASVPVLQPRQKTTAAATDDAKRKAPGRESTSADAATRGSSIARTNREQQSSNMPPRSASQQNERPSSQQSPVVDKEAWPTPESALVDAGRRSSIVDKLDKADTTDIKPTSRKNQWTAMPFVPSVKFETQIPSSRRGGRPATRGRGGLNGQGDRTAEKGEAGSMGPPPPPKTASDQDRGSKNIGGRSARSSSLPKDGQTPLTAEVPPSTSVGAMKDVTNSSEISSTTQADSVARIDTPPTQEPSRSSSRNAPLASFAQGQKPEGETGASRASDLTESPSRQSMQPERAGVSAKELDEKPQNKEWKERASNLQKSEGWRAERRGGERAERGRGTYRGRGNHTGYTTPSFTSPLPQNGFEPVKQTGQSERSRQSSQQYGSPYGSLRGNPRSQSIPQQMVGNGYYQPGSGFQQNLPPIQTDISYGGYGPVSAGIVPYGPQQLNEYAVISMVATQLEYYFSLDNLCKDMFLRKNMNSQGFVPLRTIADFRRIQALLKDNLMSYEALRHVAGQVRNIEFVVGDDGVDRLRSRENWKDFVLPAEERLPHAQSEGPKFKPNYPRHSTGMMPEYQMSNGLRSAPPHVNGYHDSFPSPAAATPFQPGAIPESQSTEQWASRVESATREDRRTSTSSPLSKIQSPTQESRGIYNNLTNGHRDSMSSTTTTKENTFPDEEVAKLKVVVKDPDFQGDDSVTPDEPIPTRVSGLRGSAGSPEQFERMRGLQFGQNMIPNKSNDHTIYFTHGEAPPQYLRPGYIHEEYLILREQAVSQRAQNHFDGACVPLYPLWAEFLTVPQQFNVGMYEDFRSWALEDLEKGNDNGKKHLVKFYDVMLSGKNPMTERLAADVINIARSEPAGERPTWLKLRAAWRNGATNMKTRKRLTDLLTADEQTELERGT